MPYRLRAGSWQPARLRRPDHQLILAWLVCSACVRGFDYLTGDDVWGARDFMLAAAPEWVWGSAFVLGGAILAAGLVRRRHLLVWLGHGWLTIAYGLNALALALSTGPVWQVVLMVAVLAASAYGVVRLPLAAATILAVALLSVWLVTVSATDVWLDGVRGAGATGLVAILHGIYHLRTGVAPIRPSGATTAEVIVSEGD